MPKNKSGRLRRNIQTDCRFCRRFSGCLVIRRCFFFLIEFNKKIVKFNLRTIFTKNFVFTYSVSEN